MSSSRDEALDLARRIVESGIPYVAFGGGEPLGVAALLGDLRAARGGRRRAQDRDRRQPHRRRRGRPDRGARRRMRADLGRRRHRGHARARASRVELRARRPARSSGWSRAASRRSSCSFPPGSTSREIVAAYDLAAALGCSAFVTGPLMRIGRAAAAWDAIACTDDEWQRAVAALRERARSHRRRDRRCRSIPGTSSPRWRRGSKARRRCCSSCPTAR